MKRSGKIIIKRDTCWLVLLGLLLLSVFVQRAREEYNLFTPIDTELSLSPHGDDPEGAYWDGKYYEPFTFVSIPKPQKLARDITRSILHIRVWLSFPFTRLVMACDEEVFDPYKKVMPTIREIFGDKRVEFIGELPTGYDNRPLIREWFKAGLKHVKSGFVCFLNADIITSTQWMKTAYRIFNTMDTISNKTVIIGARSGVEPGDWFKASLEVEQSKYLTHLEKQLAFHKKFNFIWGLDLFMMHAGFHGLNFDELPDYIIGLCFWDNFVMGWMNKRCDTVTFNYNPPLYHVEHLGGACNRSNGEMLGSMGRESPHFEGWEQHQSARWKYDWRRDVLVSSYHPEISVVERKKHRRDQDVEKWRRGTIEPLRLNKTEPWPDPQGLAL